MSNQGAIISLIKNYDEMMSDWEHRDLLINSDRIPLVDMWDIIMDIEVTLRDNIYINSDISKVGKRIDRLSYLMNVLCCPETIIANLELLADYYHTNKNNLTICDSEDSCYWDTKTPLMFLAGPDRRRAKFGLLLKKINQVYDKVNYFPFNTSLKDYIKGNYPTMDEANVDIQTQEFLKKKIETLNKNTIYDKFLSQKSLEFQTTYSVSPYLGNLTANLYKFCSKKMRSNITKNKMPVDILTKLFISTEKNEDISDYLTIAGIYFLHLNGF